MAISILGDPLVPAPLAPITNTGGLSYGLQPPLPPPASPALGMGVGGMAQPYLQLAGQQPYLQAPALGAHQQQYVQPAATAAAQQQFTAPAGGPQSGLGIAAPAALGAPPTKEESAAALAAEIGVDVITAQRIQELTLQKQQVGRDQGQHVERAANEGCSDGGLK